MEIQHTLNGISIGDVEIHMAQSVDTRETTEVTSHQSCRSRDQDLRPAITHEPLSSVSVGGGWAMAASKLSSTRSQPISNERRARKLGKKSKSKPKITPTAAIPGSWRTANAEPGSSNNPKKL
jgi:hypothetical protein